MRIFWIVATGVLASGAAAAATDDSDRVYEPGTVSTAAAEVRMAFSPDGRRRLWGSIGRDDMTDPGDIWEQVRADLGWSPPRRVSFNSDAADFDPAFSPDGTRLYFHSDRADGFGGTDLYVVDIDPATGIYATPRNLGPRVNSAGDEWAPTPSEDGQLIFSSDGWGGFGRHDLFVAALDDPGEARPRNLGATVNSAEQDFDAALAPSATTMIFSAGQMDDDDATDVRLYLSDRQPDGSWGPRARLGIGCSAFAIGASFDPRNPTQFYYAARCGDGSGRMDIRQVSLVPPVRAPSPSR